MGLVREKRRWGGWLALAALVLQLTLSFGHVHAEDFARQGSLATAPSAAATPSDGDGHDGGTHDDCAICATLHLAATLLLPPPPQVATPAVARFIVALAPDACISVHSVAQPFQARAPPRS